MADDSRSEAPAPSASSPVATDGAPSAPAPAPTPALLPRAALGAILLLAAVAFAPGVSDMWGRWMWTEDYYGHGPLVPLVSLWAAWTRRERLRALPLGSSRLGLVLLAGSVLLLVASLLEDVHFTQNLALVGAAVGLGLLLLGRAWMRELWFSFAFLLFMVPMPQLWIAHLTFDMKILAARLSTAALDLAGFVALLDGSRIDLALDAGKTVSVTVDDVCSGLRTLISLCALGAVFAWLEPRRPKALLTLALVVPIALVANVVRILVLVWLNAIESPAAHPDHWGHEAAGLSVYAVAIALLMGLRSLPFGEGDGDGAAAPDLAPPSAPPPLRRAAALGAGRLAGALALLALGAATALAFGFTTESVGQTTRTRAIPVEIAGWRGEDQPIDARVYVILGTEDVIVRRYQDASAWLPVDLYVVHAEDSRKVIHPPEICFSGGGYARTEHGVAALTTARGEVPAVRMVLARGGYRLLVYYWYRLAGRDTTDPNETRFSLLERRLRGAEREASMIRVSTAVEPGAEGLERAERRVARFAAEALAEALAPIP